MAASKAVVVIAVYNEAVALPAVLQAMPDTVDVIVVDDGSADKTVAVAKENGAYTITHLVNMGQGSALITGFRAALLHDYDYIIEMDGDGQHNPADIPRFIAYLDTTPDADILIGSRLLGSSYQSEPTIRRKMLPSVNQMINWLTGYKLTDTMCGFRVFRRQALLESPNVLYDTRGTQYVAAEWIIKFAVNKLTIHEIPIALKARAHGHSHKGLFKYAVGIMRSIVNGYYRVKF